MSSKVPNAIKCSNCHHILNLPLILPCNHSICKKHLIESSNLSICCGKCEKEHSIPKSGFQPNETLAEVIESEVNRLENSDEAYEASGRVDNEAILREIENSLKNPASFIQEQIDELRNDVKVKGAQHKLKFDQGMKSLLAKLDEYEAKCKREFSIHKYSTDAQCLNDELKLVQEEINSWIKALNKY